MTASSVVFLGSECLTVPANKLTLQNVRDSFNRQGGFLRPRPTGASGNSQAVPHFDIAVPTDLVPEGTFDFLNSTSIVDIQAAKELPQFVKQGFPKLQDMVVDTAVKNWAEQEKVSDLLPLLLTAGFSTLDVISSIEKTELESIGITRLGDQKRLILAKDRCSLTPVNTPPIVPDASFYPAANAVLSTIYTTANITPKPALPTSATNVSTSPVTPDTDTQIKIFKDLTKTQAPRRCKSNCHRWKEPRHSCTPADKCPSSDHCGHPDLHPEEKKRKREQKKDGPSDKENRDSWKKRRKQERNILLRVDRCPHFDDFYEEEMHRLVAENPRAYSLEKGTDEHALATSLVVQKYKSLKTRLKQEKAVIRQIKMELKGLPTTIDQNEYIKKRKAELLAVGSQIIFPGVNSIANSTATTTTTTTTSPTSSTTVLPVSNSGLPPSGVSPLSSSSSSSPTTPPTAPSSPTPMLTDPPPTSHVNTTTSPTPDHINNLNSPIQPLHLPLSLPPPLLQPPSPQPQLLQGEGQPV